MSPHLLHPPPPLEILQNPIRLQDRLPRKPRDHHRLCDLHDVIIIISRSIIVIVVVVGVGGGGGGVDFTEETVVGFFVVVVEGVLCARGISEISQGLTMGNVST